MTSICNLSLLAAKRENPAGCIYLPKSGKLSLRNFIEITDAEAPVSINSTTGLLFSRVCNLGGPEHLQKVERRIPICVSDGQILEHSYFQKEPIS